MDTRLRILKEAGIMFSRYGIRSITMDHIANELGISKRTLYEIFTDKDDLVSQAIEEGISVHREFCSKTVDESENVIEAIFKIGKLNNEMFGKMNPLFFEDLKKFHPAIFEKFHKKGGIKDFRLTKLLFERGIEEGVISSELNVDVINSFVHRVLELMHDDEMKKFGADALIKSALLPYFYGISTSHGRELINRYLNIY
jgi:TetR/AcrR family transcriptional regulator, cholesterol catabolism regulator